ncbi:hypothetical protein NXF25_006706 [Crotalus adamanteus]|uniref:Uncharacterized protein n=1 Tax=Crotalus adamanteus TaxID=8729 RepID=A0AAW1C0R8_CROAD
MHPKDVQKQLIFFMKFSGEEVTKYGGTGVPAFPNMQKSMLWINMKRYYSRIQQDAISLGILVGALVVFVATPSLNS